MNIKPRKSKVIPIKKYTEEEEIKVSTINNLDKKDVSEFLNGKVLGQTELLNKITPYVKLWKTGMNPKGRPSGIFLLAGYTGTGKTLTPYALAEYLHDTDKAVLRIDCAEYQSGHNVAKLIGAPPGYIGAETMKALLSEQNIRSVSSDNCGISILLFDEIEKAHEDLHQLLLGFMDTGFIRLGNNIRVNMENTIIFMTSNLGVREMIQNENPWGLSPVPAKEKNANIALDAIKKKFSPEFLNRIDETLVYNKLSSETLSSILDIELGKIETRMYQGGYSFKLEITEDIRKFILETGTSPEYGAREIKRILNRKILFKIPDSNLERKPGTLYISRKENSDDFVFRTKYNKMVGA